MPSMRIVSGALLTTVLLMSGVVAQAKTYYVEVFGDDASNCSKPAPCESISHVLDNVAGNGDRVIVGPGFYPGGLTINQTGLKLTSVAGARATTIEADGTAGITVNGDKVVVGQKKKGFTIVGSSGSSFGGNDGIYVDADKVKIEDNLAV